MSKRKEGVMYLLGTFTGKLRRFVSCIIRRRQNAPDIPVSPKRRGANRDDRPGWQDSWPRRICDRMRSPLILLVSISLLVLMFVPTQVVGPLASFCVFTLFAWFFWRIFRENWSTISVISYRQLIWVLLRTPLYCVPGFCLFGVAASLIYVFDGLLMDVASQHASISQSAEEGAQQFRNNAPSLWDFPERLIWQIVMYVMPPGRVDELFSRQAAITNILFSTLNLLGLVTWACLAFALVRFVMQVGSRLALGKGVQVKFSVKPGLSSSGKEPEECEVPESCRDNCEIVLQPGESFFVARRKTPDTTEVPQGKWPQPLSCLIPRLRWGLCRLHRYRSRVKESPICFRAVGGKHVVKLCLRDGQSLCVDCAHLIGFGGDIRLKTRWTYKLSALLVGRMFFVELSGPGTVLLETTGTATFVTPYRDLRDDVMRFIPGRLVAWNTGSVFEIDAKHNFLDIYMESVYLTMDTTEIVILNPEATGGGGNIWGGVTRWFWQALWPF